MIRILLNMIRLGKLYASGFYKTIRLADVKIEIINRTYLFWQLTHMSLTKKVHLNYPKLSRRRGCFYWE